MNVGGLEGVLSFESTRRFQLNAFYFHFKQCKKDPLPIISKKALTTTTTLPSSSNLAKSLTFRKSPHCQDSTINLKRIAKSSLKREKP